MTLRFHSEARWGYRFRENFWCWSMYRCHKKLLSQKRQTRGNLDPRRVTDSGSYQWVVFLAGPDTVLLITHSCGKKLVSRFSWKWSTGADERKETKTQETLRTRLSHSEHVFVVYRGSLVKYAPKVVWEQKTSPKLGCLGTLHEGNPCYPCAREHVADTTTALVLQSCAILDHKIHFATNWRSRLRVWMEGHVDRDGKRGSLVIASYDYRNTFSPFPPVWLYTFQFPGEKIGNVFLVAISLRTWFAQRLLTIRAWWACDSLFILVV